MANEEPGMKIFFLILGSILFAFIMIHLWGLIKPSEQIRHHNLKDTTPPPPIGALLLSFANVLSAMGAEIYVFADARVTVLTWTGRILVVLAAVWTIWTRKILGGNYAPTAQNFDPRQTLVKTGPYRWLRHPMYLGNIATVAGLMLAFNLRWAWLAMIPFLASIAWRISSENRFLEEKFSL